MVVHRFFYPFEAPSRPPSLTCRGNQHMKALWRCFASTSKKCQPRTDDAVTEAITEAAEPSDARLSDDDGDTRLAITLMTRKPHRFDWWLRYHKSLGVCHFFIHCEDTPELLELLDSDEFRGFVTVTSGEDASPDNYYTLQQRQEAQVRRSLKLCRVQRIPWLLHIDDDEILHLDVPFSAIAHHAPEGICAGPRFSLCRPRVAHPPLVHE